MKNNESIVFQKKGLLPKRLQEFMETESSSGIVMILCSILALIVANSAASELYKSFISTPITFSFGDLSATEPLKNWVKDILMVFFFLIVGLELKKELTEGFLSQKGQVLLPFAAAVAGMGIPALIYAALNYSHPETAHGWAIPSATDIAFALAMLTVFGKGIPPSVKIFLLAIAIFDDLGAIIIIAAFYNTGLAVEPLIYALIGVAALFGLNRLNVTTISPYIIVGVYLWFCLYQCGIHTTLAGVLVGVSIPVRSNVAESNYSPLNTCMHFLHPWVSFLILPIFAFTAAGVSFEGMSFESLLHPLPLGIALGLFVGKQIGIFGVTYLFIKLKIAEIPRGATFMQLYAVSILAGIGFTMSLFVGMLAFNDIHIQDMVKVGVLSGSFLAIIWGGIITKISTTGNLTK